MKLREWLDRQGTTDVTFIIAKAVKDERSPMYHNEYRETSISQVWELKRSPWVDKYIVINANHPPIDITGSWVSKFNKGHLKCAIITTEQDLHTLYCGEQAESMISYYDKTVREQMKKAGL